MLNQWKSGGKSRTEIMRKCNYISSKTVICQNKESIQRISKLANKRDQDNWKLKMNQRRVKQK